MGKRTAFGVFQGMLIVAAVLVVCFILLHIPRSEAFVSSADILMASQTVQGLGAAQNSNIDKVYTTWDSMSSLTDSNDLLKARRCYQIPVKLTKGVVDTSTYNCFCTVFEGLYSSFNAIQSRIIDEVGKFQTLINSQIKGEVYVMMHQVPYYKNARNNTPINVGFNIQEDTNFWPSNGRQDVFYRIIIVYANYDMRDMSYMSDSFFECIVINDMDKKYASNDKQCFIRCVGSNTPCGCSTAEPGFYQDDPAYSIKCFGRNKPLQDENDPATFIILFTLNKNYSLVKNKFDIPPIRA